MADYILNMGGSGMGFSDFLDTVDVFHVTENGVEKVTNHGLTLSTARSELAAASVGNYILAMGGGTDSVSYLNTVDVFHVTENGVEAITGHGLTLSTARRGLAAASVGNYILAMGGVGMGTGSNWFENTVDVFHVTENGVEAITGHGLTLSTARRELVAASAGNYLLAMGGSGSSSSRRDVIDVFHVTENGVEKVTNHGLSLSSERYDLAAASAGNYILAMGGYVRGTNDRSNAVDVFHVTENGVEKVSNHGLSLSVARALPAAASVGNYILVMGGFNNSGAVDTVDVFHVTENGVEKVSNHGLSLSVARALPAAASVGNYILVMGGEADGMSLDAVDVFQVFE